MCAVFWVISDADAGVHDLGSSSSRPSSLLTAEEAHNHPTTLTLGLDEGSRLLSFPWRCWDHVHCQLTSTLRPLTDCRHQEERMVPSAGPGLLAMPSDEPKTVPHCISCLVQFCMKTT